MQVPSHFTGLPIYTKALEIRKLSVDISQCFIDDLCELKENGKENNAIYFFGDIIQQSSALAPEILNVERYRNHFGKKKYHVNSLYQLTKLLNRNCKRLERSNKSGRDYLQLLRSELKHFSSLQKKWMLTL